MRSTSASTSFTEPAAGFKITNVLAIFCEREREEIVLLRTTPQRITVVEAGKIGRSGRLLAAEFPCRLYRQDARRATRVRVGSSEKPLLALALLSLSLPGNLCIVAVWKLRTS